MDAILSPPLWVSKTPALILGLASAALAGLGPSRPHHKLTARPSLD